MKSKTTVNIEPLVNLLQQGKKAEEAAADKLLSMSDPYVPFRTGDLAANGEVHASMGNTYIEWNLDYANYIYKGKVMTGSKPKQVTDKPLSYGTARHPLAGPQWDQRAINDHPGALEKVVVEALLNG